MNNLMSNFCICLFMYAFILFYIFIILFIFYAELHIDIWP